MVNLYQLICADYLERVRNYSFLVTLALTIYLATLFVPAPDASYTTLSTSSYHGVYNSAWVGHMSAVMTALMLSLYGFLLVNTAIRKDIDTGVGQIIAASPVSACRYLLAKQLSNFMLLLSIAACTLLAGLVMFSIRGQGYAFHPGDFLLPYLICVLPALFLVSGLAVVAEVLLGKRSLLQFILYFLLFMAALVLSRTHEMADPTGISVVTGSIERQLYTQFHQTEQVAVGFISQGNQPYQLFTWNGAGWSKGFIISRLLWMLLSVVLVYISAFFFHRFDFKRPVKRAAKQSSLPEQAKEQSPATVFRQHQLPPVTLNYSLLPMVKTELLLMYRQGGKALNWLSAALWLALCLAPLPAAYAYLLPVVYFLQVTRWSGLVTREKTFRLHYFTYASFRPLYRLLPAQALAGVISAVLLSLPVVIRLAFAGNLTGVVYLICGSVFIVLLSMAMGILSGGKKLFEVVFFLLTYAVLNQFAAADYLGGLPHAHAMVNIMVLLGLNAGLGLLSFYVRKGQLEQG